MTSMAQPGGGAAFFVQILPLLLIFVIFYMLMIRPQQKRMKEHQATIAAVKKGDEVVTAGGIRGRVTKVSDEEVEVEIANGVQVRVVKVDAEPSGQQFKQAGQRLMLDFPRWKVWAVALTIAFGILFAVPSLIAGSPLAERWPGWLPRAKINLGLDLAGGAICCSRPMPATPQSSASQRWKKQSRPSSAAAIRGSTSAISRPAAGGCRSWFATRASSMRRSSGCAP